VRDRRTEIVSRGYDVIADRFERWTRAIKGDPRESWTRELLQRLPDEARVADLGCGTGLPSTKALTDAGHEVTGIDVSAEQIRRAERNVPCARFIQADVADVELEPGGFDAVTAYYSLNHVPRERLGPLLSRISAWLAPGGFFLGALGAGGSPDWSGEWLGTTMFFSSWDPETNRRLLGAAGLATIRDEVVTLHEPEGDSIFQWVLAQR
jgi:SAM-dependent methyltransferase